MKEMDAFNFLFDPTSFTQVCVTVVVEWKGHEMRTLFGACV